jgi:hypothetical protein
VLERGRCWRTGDGRADPDLGRARSAVRSARLKRAGHDIIVDVVAEHAAAIRAAACDIGPVGNSPSPRRPSDELAGTQRRIFPR